MMPLFVKELPPVSETPLPPPALAPAKPFPPLIVPDVTSVMPPLVNATALPPVAIPEV
jgi:hypothetical protein